MRFKKDRYLRFSFASCRKSEKHTKCLLTQSFIRASASGVLWICRKARVPEELATEPSTEQFRAEARLVSDKGARRACDRP